MARPIAYDRKEVIAAACDQFWNRGFEACDIDSITRTSGINRHSLYKAFGGKNGLFLDALHFYIEKIASDYLACLETAEGLDGILAYFDLVTGAARTVGGYDSRGCFITNAVMELGRSNRSVSDMIDRYYARIEQAFLALVLRGQQKDMIRRDLDPAATAQWLLLTSQGMSVAARNGAIPANLSGIIHAALAAPPAQPTG